MDLVPSCFFSLFHVKRWSHTASKSFHQTVLATRYRSKSGRRREDNDAEIDKNEADAEQPDEQEPVADPARDLEIAWENLDIARSILSAIVQDFDTATADENTIALKSDSATPAYTSEQQKDMLLDLAQIHTQLGEVQCSNGNASAIDDYSRSLEIRRDILGEFDKLVADNHYYLAQAYGEAPAKEKERQEQRLVSEHHRVVPQQHLPVQ